MNYSNEFPIFLLRKHYCVQCGSLLVRKKQKRVIPWDSKEARHYDPFDNVFSGDVHLTYYCLECPNCMSVYTVKEQREFEKAEKARRKLEKREQ